MITVNIKFSVVGETTDKPAEVHRKIIIRWGLTVLRFGTWSRAMNDLVPLCSGDAILNPSATSLAGMLSSADGHVYLWCPIFP